MIKFAAKSIKQTLKRHFRSAVSPSLNEKVVVFESDDWGTIRMPSRAVYKKLLDFGIRVDKCHYCRYDAIESEDDLSGLFEVLRRFRGADGRHPVITANSIMANPDFDAIRSSNFGEYTYELFTETYKRYPNRSKSMQLVLQGMADGVFFPQFHGREHLNVRRWMRALQDSSRAETRLAFDHGMFGISTQVSSEERGSYMAALDFDDSSDIGYLKEVLSDGLDMFSGVFGYSSRSFIAPNYVWHPDIEHTLAGKEVVFLQGIDVQSCPKGTGQMVRIKHRTGERNARGQLYLVRNSFFEPAANEQMDWVSRCLKEIETAFMWNTAAIVSVHRVNFIGELVEANRTRNLRLFEDLLRKITRRWPDVTFATTSALGDRFLKGDSQ